eukprot:g7473.t1
MDARAKMKAANKARLQRMESSAGPGIFSRAVTNITTAHKTAQSKYLSAVERMRKRQLEHAMAVEGDVGASPSSKAAKKKDASAISTAPTQEQVEEHRKDI